MNHSGHFLTMAILMVLSGLLSTMNMWADKWSDMRLSINDAYMIGLMTGWMLFFMGLTYKFIPGLMVGALLVIASLYAIRNQLFVTEQQFLLGMIPHHSMAVLMSKQLQQQPNTIGPLLDNIIHTQEQEIQFMKQKLL